MGAAGGGVDVRRLTWLIGPPGAGKTTFAGVQRDAGVRVVEAADMLGPLVEPAGICKGMLAANGALLGLIRALELHPGNRSLAPLLVVVGVAPEEVLFGGDPELEDVWLLLPDREHWRVQLHGRPHGTERVQYDDHAYAEQLYERCERWLAEGRPIVRLNYEHHVSLLGRLPTQERLRGPSIGLERE